MRKLTVVVVCFLFLLCGYYVPASANSGHGGAAVGVEQHKLETRSFLNATTGPYFKEVYTALDPDLGFAEKYFYTGETIYFVGEIYLPTVSTFDAFTIITDAGGKVILLDGYSHTPPTSSWYFYFATDSLPAGNYNVNILVLNYSGGILLTPVAFSFVIL